MPPDTSTHSRKEMQLWLQPPRLPTTSLQCACAPDFCLHTLEPKPGTQSQAPTDFGDYSDKSVPYPTCAVQGTSWVQYTLLSKSCCSLNQAPQESASCSQGMSNLNSINPLISPLPSVQHTGEFIAWHTEKENIAIKPADKLQTQTSQAFSGGCLSSTVGASEGCRDLARRCLALSNLGNGWSWKLRAERSCMHTKKHTANGYLDTCII